MEFIIYGKKYNIQKDILEKLILIIGISVCIILFYILIVITTFNYYEVSQKIIAAKEKNNVVRSNYNEAFNRFSKVKAERLEEHTRLVNFRNEILFDYVKGESELKEMVSEISNYLDLEITDIGETEEGEIESFSNYKLIAIPYKINGKGYNIGRFLYYLENSYRKLAFKNLPISITRIDESEKLEIYFKIGTYLYENSEVNISDEK